MERHPPARTYRRIHFQDLVVDDTCIQADSFFVFPKGVEVFRIAERGTATVLWTSRTLALRYLERIQFGNYRLQGR